MTDSLLDAILKKKTNTYPFALIYRPGLHEEKNLDIMVGDILNVDSIKSIVLPQPNTTTSGNYNSVLALIPHRQLVERGFDCIDDGSPLITMQITEQERISHSEAIKKLPDLTIELSEGDFDISDNEYAEIVQKIIKNEINNGEGANFVINRQFIAEISDYTIQSALTIFRRLLQKESGAYWIFLIHTKNRTFVGASPELHISLKNNIATMNPISGTYRYPSSGPTLDGILNFLSTSKEADELYMVVEEELKMIASFCPQGGKVTGPLLKEMSRLAHTEYFIHGQTFFDPLDILQSTLFAPTVTGSPLKNACRIIAKYELKGRQYYGGIAALFGRDELGNITLDSTILIRTADIKNNGVAHIGIGTTIVRNSDPSSETAETWGKIRALLDAMQQSTSVSYSSIIQERQHVQKAIYSTNHSRGKK